MSAFRKLRRLFVKLAESIDDHNTFMEFDELLEIVTEVGPSTIGKYLNCIVVKLMF